MALYRVRRRVSAGPSGAVEEWDHESHERRYAAGDTFEDRGTTWKVLAVEPGGSFPVVPGVGPPGAPPPTHLWARLTGIAHSLSHRLAVPGFGGQLHVERPHVYDAVLLVESSR